MRSNSTAAWPAWPVSLYATASLRVTSAVNSLFGFAARKRSSTVMARGQSLSWMSCAPASYSACAAIFEVPATCAMRRKSSTAPAASPPFCLASAWR